MSDHEQPSPFHKSTLPDTSGRAPYFRQPHAGYDQPYQRVSEDTLKTSEVPIERKLFILTLKENPRGRFLRITEDVGGRNNSIIIPSTGLAEFKKLLDEMVEAENGVVTKNESVKPPVIVPKAVDPVAKPVKRTMSEAAKAKISAAAKARWAKIKALGK